MWRFHWQKNSLLTTTHLLSLISIANTIMALHGQSLRLSAFPPSPLLAISNNNNMNSKKFLSSIGRRLHSNRNSSTSDTSPNEEAECHQIKQTWSRIAAFHCVNVPDWVNFIPFTKLNCEKSLYILVKLGLSSQPLFF